MKLSYWQKRVNDWIKNYGVRYFDVKTNALLLGEEYGEFVRLVARIYGEQSFRTRQEEETASASLKEELTDMIFVICCLANQLEINLDETLEANIQKKTQRDNVRHHQNRKLSDS